MLAGTGTTNPASAIFGYRHGAGGAFEFGQQFPGGDTFVNPKVAINDTGTALVAWRTVTASAVYGAAFARQPTRAGVRRAPRSSPA